MDDLYNSIKHYKQNDLVLNDLTNQQDALSDRLEGFFEKIWGVFAGAKLSAVPNNGWFRYKYKGFKIKGSTVRLIGSDIYHALDDRTITIPLATIERGPAAVGSFIGRKVRKDVVEAAKRQEREDREKLAEYIQQDLDNSMLQAIMTPLGMGVWPKPDGGAFVKFRVW